MKFNTLNGMCIFKTTMQFAQNNHIQCLPVYTPIQAVTWPTVWQNKSSLTIVHGFALTELSNCMPLNNYSRKNNLINVISLFQYLHVQDFMKTVFKHAIATY